MYLAHELKATFSFSRSPNAVLLNTTSQYKNWRTISDVTSFFLRVSIGGKCVIGHNLFNVKNKFRQILFIWSLQVKFWLIIRPRLFTFAKQANWLLPKFICGLVTVQDVFGLTIIACNFDELMDSWLAIVHRWIRLRSSFKRTMNLGPLRFQLVGIQMNFHSPTRTAFSDTDMIW
jgi:hypothetical protein